MIVALTEPLLSVTAALRKRFEKVVVKRLVRIFDQAAFDEWQFATSRT